MSDSLQVSSHYLKDDAHCFQVVQESRTLRQVENQLG